MYGPGKFTFLNETRELQDKESWNDPSIKKLWLYNLHYFEDLISESASKKTHWHRALIDRWIQENAVGVGNGWEPYPVSLRIGNWIKWALKGNPMDKAWKRSLALQTEYLYHNIEWHILGNHVFENGKALVLAGCYFEGEKADKWRRKGCRILAKQLKEQILPDGGHFERSPMYQGIVLEGLLDVVQISNYYGMNREMMPIWKNAASLMLQNMKTMTHPDGGIAFFNDATFGVSVSTDGLEKYAQKNDIKVPARFRRPGATYCEETGYIRIDYGSVTAILDVAPTGPDYLLGHAHADTLSFEMSFRGHRVFVNSGTGGYESGEERMMQRGTSAHNTVVVDGADSTEVWSAFRVARRAVAFDVTLREHGEGYEVRAAHNGYKRLKGRNIHRRSWILTDKYMTIEDVVEGEFKEAIAYYHLHPAVELERNEVGVFVTLSEGSRIGIYPVCGDMDVVATKFYPEFGKIRQNYCIVLRTSGPMIKTKITWQAAT